MMEGWKGSPCSLSIIECTNINKHARGADSPGLPLSLCVTLANLLTLPGLSFFIYKMGCCFPHPSNGYLLHVH